MKQRTSSESTKNVITLVLDSQRDLGQVASWHHIVLVLKMHKRILSTHRRRVPVEILGVTWEALLARRQY